MTVVPTRSCDEASESLASRVDGASLMGSVDEASVPGLGSMAVSRFNLVIRILDVTGAVA